MTTAQKRIQTNQTNAHMRNAHHSTRMYKMRVAAKYSGKTFSFLNNLFTYTLF